MRYSQARGGSVVGSRVEEEKHHTQKLNLAPTWSECLLNELGALSNKVTNAMRVVPVPRLEGYKINGGGWSLGLSTHRCPMSCT